jgi:hypothetical protein
MAKAKTYPRDRWIPEIPFDVAEWGDTPEPWPEGLFRSEQELRQAKVAALDLPQGEPRPK